MKRKRILLSSASEEAIPRCSNCDKQISDEDLTCPHCGAVPQDVVEEQQVCIPDVWEVGLGSKFAMYLGVLGFCLPILGVILGRYAIKLGKKYLGMIPPGLENQFLITRHNARCAIVCGYISYPMFFVWIAGIAWWAFSPAPPPHVEHPRVLPPSLMPKDNVP
jgi:hypothetical protein